MKKIFLLLFILSTLIYANNQKLKHILVLHSYNQSMSWVQNINEAIEDTLNPIENGYVIHTENMDTKRIYSKQYLEELKHMYKVKYRDVKFDFILSSDNNAFDFLRQNRDELFGNTPVSFCGVNFFKDSDLDNLENFTGVAETFDAKNTLKIALKLYPEAREVFIINDYLKTGRAWEKTIKEQLNGFDEKVKITYAQNLSMNKLQDTISSLGKNTIVLLGVYFKDKDGKYFTYEKIGEMISTSSKNPVFCLLEFNLNHGVVGGSVIGGYYQGEAMSKIAKDILNGKPIFQLPVLKEGATRYVFDYNGLKKFNMDISILPTDAIVLNKPITFYQKHKSVLLLGTFLVVVMLIVIVILLINNKIIKKAQNDLEQLKDNLEIIVQNRTKELKEQKAVFEKLFYKTNDALLLISDYKFIDCNDSAIKMLDVDSKDNILGKHPSELSPKNQEDEKSSFEKANKMIDICLKNGSHNFEWLHKKSNGEVLWIDISLTKIKIAGKNVIHTLWRDITKKKQQEKIASLRHELSELVHQNSSDKLLQRALDTAESITQSQIGFYHFIDEDQENISLQVWSTNTLEKMCFAEGQSVHYPISKAGVWADCIHQRKPVIHNDYESLPHKKGLPIGHTPLVRELTVPVFRNGLIVAVIGVGNKEQEYNSDEVSIVQEIADMAYDYSERLRTEQKIEFMAYYDNLTNLPNRTLLTDRLNQTIASHRRTKHYLAVCFMDLDGFKPVNDQYGHHIGDKLLIDISKRIGLHMREEDTFARIGGDEFVLAITNLSDSDGYKELIQRIVNAVNTPFNIDEHRIHISCSIGITVFPTDNSDTDVLIRHADQAMYQAKEDSKASYKLYQQIEDAQNVLNEELLEEFATALIENQLILHYQPKIDLRNGSVIGVETLVRWLHPKKGLLFPNEFLPHIEDTPLEIRLDEWVVKKAFEQKMEFDKLELFLTLSINISPRHIQLEGFVDFISNALSIYHEDFAQNIELEILETSTIGDIKNVNETMKKCAEFGISFSLDDFGTGYASLTHLHNLPIDILKIDQNFVKDMLTDSNDLDIVEGVLKLANTINKPVIAEGVESIEIGLMLLSLGCQYAQGYGIARPMPKDKLLTWLNEWQDRSLWFKLQDETSKDTAHYDINIAIFTHGKWLNNVIEYIELFPAKTEIPLNGSECQFGHWYKGIGRSRYGDKESYAFVQAKHNSAHEFATKLIKLVQAGQKEKALSQIDELKEHAAALVDLLRKMALQ